MGYSRTTPSGRRITATPRLREETDMEGLVALVLHLAEQLHEQEQHDHADRLCADEEGHDDDTAAPGSTSG